MSITARRSRLSRRQFVASTAATVGAASLAACGGASVTTPAAQALQPVTLRYLATFEPSSGTTFAASLSKVVEMWHEKGGPIKVEPLPVTGNRTEKTLAMVSAGDAPDLSHALPRDHHPMANAGALLDIGSYIRKDRRAQDVLPVVLEYWARGDVRYAMPNNFSPQAIYFNKSLFAKQGLKTPDQYEKEGKWTFDTYLDLARKLTTGGGTTGVYGAPWTSANIDIQLAFIWPFGGDMFDKELKSTLLDSPASLEAIQFQADLTHKYHVSFDAEVGSQTKWRGIGGALAAGQGGIEVLTTDVVGLLTPATFEKGMAPMPTGKAGRVVRANPIGIHIMKDSKAHDASWEYVAFQSGPDSAKLMLDRHLTVPWLKSLLGSQEHAKRLNAWESAAAYAESVSKVRPTKYPSAFGEINSLYGKAYADVRHGRKAARQAIAEIKPQIEQLLRTPG